MAVAIGGKRQWKAEGYSERSCRRKGVWGEKAWQRGERKQRQKGEKSRKEGTKESKCFPVVLISTLFMDKSFRKDSPCGASLEPSQLPPDNFLHPRNLEC